jgi:hypothetical protein
VMTAVQSFSVPVKVLTIGLAVLKLTSETPKPTK